jgi:hypothetical protein
VSENNLDKEGITMEAFVLTLILVSLLILGGIVLSVRLYRRRLLETGGFRRVRRVRTITPLPDGRMVEETIVETVDEEALVKEEA